jgi:hypothetical protein
LCLDFTFNTAILYTTIVALATIVGKSIRERQNEYFDLARAVVRPNLSMLDALIEALITLAKNDADRELIRYAIAALDDKYALSRKIEREPGVADIIKQFMGRIANAFGEFGRVRGIGILDIACGSNTSRAPASVYIDSPFGKETISNSTEGYTAQFEPWFCRTLLELRAEPVGVDLGDLSGEAFEHYAADLGKKGALDFLPSHSFDALQDSRLFGSPEFTAEFPEQAERLRVAREMVRQEQRLLKQGGIVIHSDAANLLK